MSLSSPFAWFSDDDDVRLWRRTIYWPISQIYSFSWQYLYLSRFSTRRSIVIDKPFYIAMPNLLNCKKFSSIGGMKTRNARREQRSKQKKMWDIKIDVPENWRDEKKLNFIEIGHRSTQVTQCIHRIHIALSGTHWHTATRAHFACLVWDDKM